MTADGRPATSAGNGVSGEAPPRVGADGGTTTLVAGTSFCLSAVGGDLDPGGVQGLFVDDTRVVSAWRLRIDGAPVEPLGVVEGERFRATFVGRTPRGRTAPTRPSWSSAPAASATGWSRRSASASSRRRRPG